MGCYYCEIKKFSLKQESIQMVIFCDEINWSSFYKIIWIRIRNHRRKDASTGAKIFILDGRNKKFVSGALERLLITLGFGISEKQFSAGTMAYDDNESVMSKAFHVSAGWSYIWGKDVLKNSRFLGGLAKKRGKELLLRRCTQPVMRLIMNTVSRVLVAHTFMKKEGHSQAYLIIENSPSLRNLSWATIAPGLDMRFYNPYFFKTSRGEHYAQSKFEYLKQTSLGGVFLLLYFLKTLITSLLTKKFVPELKAPKAHEAKSLLLLQDDDIGLGGALRSHPFWVTPKSIKPDYRIYILEDVSFHRLNQGLDEALLASKNIFLIPANFRFNIFSLFSCSIVVSLLKDFLKCVLISFFGSPQERFLMFPLGFVLCRAMVLSGLCKDLNVEAFMSCETYKPDSDAIHCLEKEMKITTLTYQYANIRAHSPVMMPSSHIMFSFSPLYHEVWGMLGSRPERYVDIGYVYSSSRSSVEPRACQVRKKLIQNGATFILAYFDENFGTGKYVFLHVDECYETLQLLLNQVNQDKTFGLVVKTQFMRNLPGRLTDLVALRDKALASGRYVELYEGHHRNNILPMEAALASDMTIGHYIGATASLESAVVGKRSVMVNSCRFKGMFGNLFERPHLLYTSCEEALEDLKKYRQGNPVYQDMGDWQPFIKQLDPFLDDKASQRIRTEIDRVMAGFSVHTDH